jgi:hypothetical protein
MFASMRRANQAVTKLLEYGAGFVPVGNTTTCTKEHQERGSGGAPSSPNVYAKSQQKRRDGLEHYKSKRFDDVSARVKT